MDIHIDSSSSSDTIKTNTSPSIIKGRIIIGLFGYNAPTASENFRLLSKCTHYSQRTNHNNNKSSKSKPLCYKNTIFHRIIPNFAIQGGDITHHNGIGGEAAIVQQQISSTADSTTKTRSIISSSSIVPPPPPPPIGTYQPYMINQTKFNHPYLVAVATPNHMLARSQFFITTVKAQWLSGQYTIFGMILSGTEFIQEIEQYGTYGGQPTTTITIVDCNELPLRPEDKKPHY